MSTVRYKHDIDIHGACFKINFCLVISINHLFIGTNPPLLTSIFGTFVLNFRSIFDILMLVIFRIV